MKPFRLQVPDSALADLRERLARTRLPDEPPGPPWKTGASLAYIKELLEYWRSGFDWRAQEAKLNAFRQYKASVRGTELHFIHEPGRGAKPVPLGNPSPGVGDNRRSNPRRRVSSVQTGVSTPGHQPRGSGAVTH